MTYALTVQNVTADNKKATLELAHDTNLRTVIEGVAAELNYKVKERGRNRFSISSGWFKSFEILYASNFKPTEGKMFVNDGQGAKDTARKFLNYGGLSVDYQRGKPTLEDFLGQELL